MPLLITVEVRSVYGRDAIYPVCDKAAAFAAIAGTTTITPDALRHIRALGYAVQCARQRIPALEGSPS